LTSQNDGGLELEADGFVQRFPAIWLRDNCPCAECLDPDSGQKLKDITELPDRLAVSAAQETGEWVLVTFAPDGHRSTFSRSWLAAHALGSGDMDPRTIGDIADYMTGITRMSAAKANAQDTWLGQPGNSSKNSDIFERMWRSNADPRLFQIAEMRDAGAQQDYAKLHIRKSEVADLTKKHEWLVHVGALPPDQQQVAPASAGGAGAPAPTGGATGQW